MDEFAGMEELAEILGVAKITAKRYASRDDFPEPVAVLAGGRVWRRGDVVAWAETHRPRRGRPRKSEESEASGEAATRSRRRKEAGMRARTSVGDAKERADLARDRLRARRSRNGA